MKILGIQLGHNSTVALLIDGRITHVVSQEKFDNIKNSSNFPKEAILWILSASNLQPKDIDYIAICGLFIFPHQLFLISQPKTTNQKKQRLKLKQYLKDTLAIKFPEIYWWYWVNKNNFKKKNIRRKLITQLSEIFGLKPDELEKRLVFVKHHFCHAYSAFYSDPDKKLPALILTVDGSGDYSCSTVNIAQNNNEFKRIASTRWLHSPGYVYSEVTRFLGMKALEHEYKVMGLAPYSRYELAKEIYEKIFKRLLWINRDKITFTSSIPTNRLQNFLKNNLIGLRFDNLAGGLQLWLEELITQWIKNCIELTDIKNIYLGGGVFMNVKLNKKIMEMDEIDYCYFMPSCGDESNPIGACYYVYKLKTGKDPLPLENLYLGPSYTNEEIKMFLNKLGTNYKIEFYEDIEKKVAELLADFKIVARFKGRAEWGARALGNRSILGNPSDLKTFYEINDIIKQRDFWMPFAPSILDEDKERYIKNPKKIKAPYMILAFDSTELARNHLKAAMHQADKTLRPQIVYREQNPDYWRLIQYFKEKTGIGGILNTSLNLHGYPLVATLDQLLFTLKNSKLKYVAVENYLITKE